MTRFTNIGWKKRRSSGFSAATGANAISTSRGTNGNAGDGRDTEKSLRTPYRKPKTGEEYARRRAESSEKRRLKRLAERRSSAVCFSCRQKGHNAQSCPSAPQLEGHEGSNKGRASTIICYRCGSNKHRLNACKKPEDTQNPLPFAACFICSGKGHIAAACPGNPNGVYPNGGCCRLCGQKDHLVKDCRLRQDSTGATNGNLALEPDVIANFKETAPDEDDFHTLNRRRQEVEQEEELQERRNTIVKAAEKAAQSTPGIQKPRPAANKSKVVKF